MAEQNVLEDFLVKLTVQGPDSGQIRAAESGLESLSGGLKRFAAAYIAIDTVEKVAKAIFSFAESMKDAFYAAQKLGSTTERITALGDAAERAGGSVDGIRADLDSLVTKMRSSPAFKDWLKTNLHLSAEDMETAESTLVASSKALAAMRETDPQHYKALQDYIGTSEQTILAVARPEFDEAWKQQKEFVKGLDGVALKSKAFHEDWISAKTHFNEAFQLISGPFITAVDVRRTFRESLNRRLFFSQPRIGGLNSIQTVTDILAKLKNIPFGRIADDLFDGMQKGLAKINFENVKTVFPRIHELARYGSAG